MVESMLLMILNVCAWVLPISCYLKGDGHPPELLPFHSGDSAPLL